MRTEMPRRPLGRTGFDVSALSLGGVMYHRLPDEEAAAVVGRAIDLGINYIDTAAGYDDGESERKIGLGIDGRREGLYLATKSTRRDRDGAMADIEGSLKRLGVEVIDCLQVHDISTEKHLAELLGPKGAIKAIEEFRAAGQVRFIGVTGHRNPEILVRAMQEYPFDTLLVSLGATHAAVRPFYDAVMPVAAERGIGVIGMKVMTFGLLKDHAEAALRYVLGLEGVSSALVGIDDLEQLERNVAIARKCEPLADEEQAELLEVARALYENSEEDVWSIHLPEGTV